MKRIGTIELVFVFGTIAYLSGMMFIDIMDIDASLYAEMSREMLESVDLLDFRNRAIDRYLDKPPLIFWLSVFSYYLFGVSDFVYRLPTFLSTLLGAFSVFRMTKIYYGDRDIAVIASTFLFTCQAWFLINHDVRTDTLLANFVIFASWQLAEYLRYRRPWNFILAFAGIGVAMMAKGPIGLMIPAIGFSLDLLIKRRWKDIFRPEWLLGILILLITISPMIVSLYRQYGIYGLEFYFWTQSFGRITGSNYWQDSSGPFFFVHTFLWSFLPWSILTIGAIVITIRKLIRSNFNKGTLPEYITILGFLVAFVMLSRSSYKLPHYIYVVFPYIAVFTAAGCVNFLRNTKNSIATSRFLGVVQYFISGILILAALVLVVWVFPIDNIFIALSLILFAGLSFYYIVIKGSALRRWVYLSFFAILLANFTLNIQVYPKLMDYQASRSAAEYIKTKNIPTSALFQLNYHSSSFDFYLGDTPPEVNVRKIERLSELKGGVYILTNEPGYEEMLSTGRSIQVIKEFDNYRVQTLTLNFINPVTRDSALEKLYLLKI